MTPEVQAPPAEPKPFARRLVVRRPDGIFAIFGRADKETFPDGELCPFTFDDFSGTFYPTRVDNKYILFEVPTGQIDLPLEGSEVRLDDVVVDQLIEDILGEEP